MQSYRRTEYTYEERKTIIEHIIKRKCYNALRGNTFWQEMETRQILQRTWQSLKEHFRKKIIDIIHTFDLPDEEVRLIKEGWASSRVVKQDGNGRKVKRPRYNSVVNVFSDEENKKSSKHKSRQDKNEIYNVETTDGSDSSASTYINTNLRRKMIVKSKHKSDDKRRRSPSEFNFFSDEEDFSPDVLPQRKLIADDGSSQNTSPDLLNNNREKTLAVSSSSITNVKKTSNKLTSSKQLVEPSTSGRNVQKNVDSIVIDSESDDVTVVDLNINSHILKANKKVISKKDHSGSNNEEVCSNSSEEEFSWDEDMSLIKFMGLGKTYLRRRKQIDIYNYFQELYPNSKSPKQLRNRFLNHIFPNIVKYNDLTHDEMKQFYKDAGVEIPNNLKLVLEKLNNTSIDNTSRNKQISDKAIQSNYDSNINSENPSVNRNDFQMNVYEHELSKSAMNYILCHITLKGQAHIFVSDTNGSSNQEKLCELLSKKFNIDTEYIHYTDFVTFSLVEQVNKFRNSVYKQYQNIITESIEDEFKDVNVEELISSLDVCIEAFPKGDEISTSESSESSSDDDVSSSMESRIINSQQTLNTQEFNPNENSTPRRNDSVNQILDQEIKQENMSTCENALAVSCDIQDQQGIKIELCSNSSNIADDKSISSIYENNEMSSEEDNNEQLPQLCLIKDEIISANDSQYLESISTQESTNIRKAIEEMAADQINVNNSVQIPLSSEIFHSAIGFTQDLI